ncbi:hypothetical protein C0992_012347 [Termitomyces sp. T32_za158]|nr:hypothetical protein C0992_012347 [Termitomyces sp. T32_za158]
MSEIDDIFASKGEGSIVRPSPSTYTSSQDKTKNKKNKKRKRDEHLTEQSSQCKPHPKTVIDTSNSVTKVKGLKIEDKSRPHKARKVALIDDAKFRDSRGSGSRKTTEEGWLIYKEEELGIRDEGGGKHIAHRLFSPFTSGFRHFIMSL